MIKLFQKLRSNKAQALAEIPAGQRVYAMGDIHGRLDLFEALIEAIEQDDASADPADTMVILLGDLVDRGPDSKGVLARARAWQQQRAVRILAGNHEEMFLRSFEEAEILRHFLRHGGKETVLSYGVSLEDYLSAELKDVQAMLVRHVPQEDRSFVSSFEDMIRVGDYLFVHAGIEPGKALEEQATSDLRWIREPFLSHTDPHGPVVVHGHTISRSPEDRGNRIGIDTGAYRSGRLTALVLEGTTRRFIEASEGDDGAIAAGPRELAA